MNASLRIAIADDEPDMREYFARILPLLGHRVVVTARDGNDLVTQCQEAHPDLVITDVKMPDLDGIEAAERLWQREPVPVIVVTAYHDRSLGESAPIMAMLTKPIRQADLAPAISGAMRRFAEREAHFTGRRTT